MINGVQLTRPFTEAMNRHEYVTIIRLEGLPNIFYPGDTLGQNIYPPIGAVRKSTSLDKPYIFFALTHPNNSCSSLCIDI